jgi:hypothetical protein
MLWVYVKCMCSYNSVIIERLPVHVPPVVGIHAQSLVFMVSVMQRRITVEALCCMELRCSDTYRSIAYTEALLSSCLFT